MFTEKRVGDTSHNDHNNSAQKDIQHVKEENTDKLKPGEPVDISGTGSNYLESDLISAPEDLVDKLKHQEEK